MNIPLEAISNNFTDMIAHTITKPAIKNYLYNVLCCVFFIAATGLHAQTDSTRQRDSVNTILLQQYSNKLTEIENQRKADSIRKAALEAQLISLKTTDNLKKEELQKQLQQLENRETERLAEKKARIDSLRATAKGFAVKGFFNDTLFLIYNRLGSFMASERAAAISERIKKLADNFHFKADSLKLAESETTWDIVFHENIIMSISENDALWNNTNKKDLAQKYKLVIGDAVEKYQSEISFSSLIKEIALALLVLIILIAVIYFINKFFKWITVKIKQREGKSIKGISIKNYTLFNSTQQIKAIKFINTIIKWIVILLLIYITLPVLFGIFPWTKGFAEVLISYILTPLKTIAYSIWNYLPKFFTIVVVVIVFKYVLKVIAYLRTEVQKGALKLPGFYEDWANPTYQIIRVLLYAFMLVVIFPYLPGSNSPIFQGISVFIGVLFTFGSAGALSNVVSGLVLTYMRAFKIGDRIKIGDVTGDIIEKSLLVTRIRTIKNEIISIPNSNVMGSHTTNYSSDAATKGLIMHTTVTIGYDVPWRKIHQALLDAAARTEYLLQEPKPFVLQTGLDDFYVSYQINAYTKEANKQAVIYSYLHQNIQDCCNEAGIEILSPHYRAARDGNATTIPSDYLDDNYTSPGFNINIYKDKI